MTIRVRAASAFVLGNVIARRRVNSETRRWKMFRVQNYNSSVVFRTGEKLASFCSRTFVPIEVFRQLSSRFVLRIITFQRLNCTLVLVTGAYYIIITRRAQLYDPAYATHIIWYWVPILYDDPFWMRKTCFHDVRTRSRVKLKRRNALIKLLFTNYHNIQRGLPTRYRARVDRVRCATRVRQLYAVFIHEWTIRINGFSFLKFRAYSVLHGRRL